MPSFLSILPCTGEVFSQEELEEMLSAAVEPEKGQILYRDYAAMMCQDDQHS